MDRSIKCLSAAHLKILAMVCMLCDHLSATLLPWIPWLGIVGRLAFPIFAFQVAEGYARTGNFKRYLGRMFLFALVSEVPFDLMYGGTAFYPFHQNVMFTFCIALLCLRILDAVKEKSVPVRLAVLLAVAAAGNAVGFLTMVDYYGYGILMVLGFYLFRNARFGWLWELLMMAWINIWLLQGEYIVAHLFGLEINLYIQGFALLALIPIWLYNGAPGKHSKAVRIACYLFYPLHLLIVSLLWLHAF